MKSLKSKILIYLTLPTFIIIAVMIALFLREAYLLVHKQSIELLQQNAQNIAEKIERTNSQAINVAKMMSIAQQSALLGKREQSNDLLYNILFEFPDFTGVSIGYEPNADGQDEQFANNPEFSQYTSEAGRYLPYWYRDQNQPDNILLERLVDMEESLYYQGLKDLFMQENQASALVTEPYIYQGKLIVEHTYPILKEGKFMGMSGVDRSLDDLANALQRIKADSDIDVFLISRQGRFISTTLNEKSLNTQIVSDTQYKDILGAFYSKKGATQVILTHDPFDQKPYYFASAFIKSGSWTVVLRNSKEKVMAPIVNLIIKFTILAALGIAILTFISMRFVRSINARAKSVETTANMIATRDIGSLSITEDVTNDELTRLKESLSNVLDSYLEIDKICKAIAKGDYSTQLIKRSENDFIAESINTMSARKREYEQQLETNNNQIAKNLEQLSQMQNTIIEAEKMASLGALVAGVAHELNTPLSICKMSADQSRRYLTQFSESLTGSAISKKLLIEHQENMQHTTELMNKNIERAVVLVDRFKTIAVNQAGGTYRHFELNQHLKNIIDSCEFDIPSLKGCIHLHCEQTHHVYNDSDALINILESLIDNAISHAFIIEPEKGEIDISALQTEWHEQDAIEIRVKDNGIGMSKSQLESIFDPFYTTARNAGSVGLGLHIIHNMVSQRLGGAIACESEIDNGTEFIITFPVTVTHSEQEKESMKDKACYSV